MLSSTVYVTGAHGFVGSNLTTYLSRTESRRLVTVGRSGSDLTYADFELQALEPGSAIVHLAGKAHDLRDVTNPEAYDEVNFGLTKRVYDRFTQSDAKTFIFLSSVKAVADGVVGELTESAVPNPTTAYGVSKLKAEDYLRLHSKHQAQRTYILRPCMIHGPGNKGNLNLLYGLVAYRIPYPLGAFQNKRSLLTIENLCYVIEQIVTRKIEPGTYNVADDLPLSTNEMVTILSRCARKRPLILSPPRSFVKKLAWLGGRLRLPLTSERLHKLTEDYVVSNAKLLQALGRSSMPTPASVGLSQTALSLRKAVEVSTTHAPKRIEEN
jgi:nucleoside-diphosphate-sugar epimerase